MSDVAEVARSLTKAQREMIGGEYDPEFANIRDASVLERLGLWSYDPEKQDPDADFYQLEVTPLGLAVRQYLQENPDA